MSSEIKFEQLNIGWNAEPNSPELQIELDNSNIIIEFYLNPFMYDGFSEGDKAKIVFHNCLQYRIGSPNDEGFFLYSQSRFKKYGVKWGEFYLIHNSNWKREFPNPIRVRDTYDEKNHYLFYFRDVTFECIASDYSIKFCQQCSK